MNAVNKKLITFDLSTGSTFSYEVKGLTVVDTIGIQVDWSNLLGTYDAKLNIYTRENSAAKYIITDPSTFTDTIDSSNGSAYFKFIQWTGSDIKIEIIKNNVISGNITSYIGLRR